MPMHWWCGRLFRCSWCWYGWFRRCNVADVLHDYAAADYDDDTPIFNIFSLWLPIFFSMCRRRRRRLRNISSDDADDKYEISMPAVNISVISFCRHFHASISSLDRFSTCVDADYEMIRWCREDEIRLLMPAPKMPRLFRWNITPIISLFSHYDDAFSQPMMIVITPMWLLMWCRYFDAEGWWWWMMMWAPADDWCFRYAIDGDIWCGWFLSSRGPIDVTFHFSLMIRASLGRWWFRLTFRWWHAEDITPCTPADADALMRHDDDVDYFSADDALMKCRLFHVIFSMPITDDVRPRGHRDADSRDTPQTLMITTLWWADYFISLFSIIVIISFISHFAITPMMMPTLRRWCRRNTLMMRCGAELMPLMIDVAAIDYRWNAFDYFDAEGRLMMG